MKIIHASLISLVLMFLGCPAKEEPPVKESLYSKLQNNNNTVTDAGSADGTGEGSIDGVLDGGGDGSADGSSDGNPP